MYPKRVITWYGVRVTVSSLQWCAMELFKLGHWQQETNFTTWKRRSSEICSRTLMFTKLMIMIRSTKETSKTIEQILYNWLSATSLSKSFQISSQLWKIIQTCFRIKWIPKGQVKRKLSSASRKAMKTRQSRCFRTKTTANFTVSTT